MLTEMITALGPNDPDDGDEGRQRRGLAIAAIAKIERNRIGFTVPSQSGNGSYVVTLDNEPFCSCPDFDKEWVTRCKHIVACEIIVQRETQADGSTKVTESIKITRTSEWSIYNEAQTHEQERFTELLETARIWYGEQPDEAKQVFGETEIEGVSQQEIASWVATSRIMMNLDSFFTRE